MAWTGAGYFGTSFVDFIAFLQNPHSLLNESDCDMSGAIHEPMCPHLIIEAPFTISVRILERIKL